MKHALGKVLLSLAAYVARHGFRLSGADVRGTVVLLTLVCGPGELERMYQDLLRRKAESINTAPCADPRPN